MYGRMEAAHTRGLSAWRTVLTAGLCLAELLARSIVAFLRAYEVNSSRTVQLPGRAPRRLIQRQQPREVVLRNSSQRNSTRNSSPLEQFLPLSACSCGH